MVIVVILKGGDDRQKERSAALDVLSQHEIVKQIGEKKDPLTQKETNLIVDSH